MKPIIKINIVGLLLIVVMCCISSAKMDDILMGNDYLGGKVWLRDANSLGAINEALFGTQIKASAYQSNGCIVLAFTDNNGTVQIRNSDFSLVASQNNFGTITALVVNHKDEIIVGTATPQFDPCDPDSGLCGAVWLRNADLTEKNTYVNFGGPVTALAVQSNDNIVIGSDYSYATLWVFDPNMEILLDQQVNFTAHNPPGSGHIRAIKVRSNDDIVLAADHWSTTEGGFNHGKVWIRKADNVRVGIGDFTNFGGQIADLALQSDDKVIVASPYYMNGTVFKSMDPNLTSANWISVHGFGAGPNDINSISAIAVQSNDNIVVASNYATSTLWLRDPNIGDITNAVNFGGQITTLSVEPQTYLPMDLNRDKYVNFIDFAILATTENVEFMDVAALAEEWLKCTDPYNSLCN